MWSIGRAVRRTWTSVAGSGRGRGEIHDGETCAARAAIAAADHDAAAGADPGDLRAGDGAGRHPDRSTDRSTDRTSDGSADRAGNRDADRGVDGGCDGGLDGGPDGYADACRHQHPAQGGATGAGLGGRRYALSGWLPAADHQRLVRDAGDVRRRVRGGEFWRGRLVHHQHQPARVAAQLGRPPGRPRNPLHGGQHRQRRHDLPDDHDHAWRDAEHHVLSLGTEGRIRQSDAGVGRAEHRQPDPARRPRRDRRGMGALLPLLHRPQQSHFDGLRVRSGRPDR